MPFVDPTPASLRERFPKFISVGDGVLQGAIDEAGRRVDTTWAEGDYTLAKMLYAAHVLSLDGIGDTGAADIISEFGPNVSKLKANLTEVTFNGSVSGVGAGGGGASTLSSTTYGQRFKELQRINFAGPRVTGAGAGGLSGYATDWPLGPRY